MRTIRFSIWTWVTILVSSSLLATYFARLGSSNSPPSPTHAVVHSLEGWIERRSRKEGAQTHPIQQRDWLDETHVLHVPMSTTGSNENWVHLEPSVGNDSLGYLVQVGPDYDISNEYIFPCRTRTGMIGWTVQSYLDNDCYISPRILQTSQGVDETHIAQKLDSKIASEKTHISYQETSQLRITPEKPFTLVYFQDNYGSTVVNVLSGAAQMRSDGELWTVEEGLRFTSNRGSGNPIDFVPDEVYTSRPVQIFINPDNWSQEVGPQIRNFQTAIERHTQDSNNPGNQTVNLPDSSQGGNSSWNRPPQVPDHRQELVCSNILERNFQGPGNYELTAGEIIGNSSIRIPAFDPDGDSLSVEVSQSQHDADVRAIGGMNVVYTARYNPSYHEDRLRYDTNISRYVISYEDRFQYTVSDGYYEDTGNITVNVNCVYDKPPFVE
ncbi:MAG: hypothetical protein QNJ46_23190 [Leptolyngbyaceae cyanobacterium MO_188.B28]|nr:hypothetical protein [Leptolyngbyaceae cyanobacterium MO_188.B28]